jgi:hypothetical protein
MTCPGLRKGETAPGCRRTMTAAPHNQLVIRTRLPPEAFPKHRSRAGYHQRYVAKT